MISEEMITIDDRPYRVADFSDKAKAELGSLQACDSAVAALKVEAEGTQI